MRTHVPRRLTLAMVALNLALAAPACGSAALAPTRPTASCPSYIVPAYQDAWATANRVLADPKRVRVVILGSAGITHEQKLKAVKRLQARGIKVLGYTFTRGPGPYDESTFGTRPLRQVKAEITAAKRTYGVDGMFVDNVTALPARLPYYKAISDFIRSQPGTFVVFNGPGTPDLVPLADVLVAFEGYYRDFIGFRPPAWAERFPARKFAEIVHDIPLGAGAAASAIARRTHAGNVFLTDSGFPHPYGRMPLLQAPACR